uniref:Uncharacterized protein n=1 Tax=Anguilla anguilla TaxID=7936 RepID=A0A0E9V7B8_ANGAN
MLQSKAMWLFPHRVVRLNTHPIFSQQYQYICPPR